jgi:LAO/AO transport system kinase
VSAIEEAGLSEAWGDMQSLVTWRKAHGHYAQTRADQAQYWFVQDIRNGLLRQLDRAPLKEAIQGYAAQVAKGEISASCAAQTVLDALKGLPSKG